MIEMEKFVVNIVLDPKKATLENVKKMPAFAAVEIDKEFGLINVSKKKKIYAVRVIGKIDSLGKSVQIIGVFPEMKIEPF